MKSEIAAMLAVGFLVMFSGCLMTPLVNGNGPLPFEQISDTLPAARQEQIAQWESDVRKNGKLPVYISKELAKGGFALAAPYLPNHDLVVEPKDSALRLIWGGKRDWSELWIARTPTARTVLHHDMERRVLMPFGPSYHWAAAYDAETGQTLAYKTSVSCLLNLIFYARITAPVDEVPPLLDRREPLSDVKCTHRRAFCLGYGLVAGGVVNGRAYAQLLFFPIPLWSTN